MCRVKFSTVRGATLRIHWKEQKNHSKIIREKLVNNEIDCNLLENNIFYLNGARVSLGGTVLACTMCEITSVHICTLVGGYSLKYRIVVVGLYVTHTERDLVWHGELRTWRYWSLQGRQARSSEVVGMLNCSRPLSYCSPSVPEPETNPAYPRGILQSRDLQATSPAPHHQRTRRPV